MIEKEEVKKAKERMKQQTRDKDGKFETIPVPKILGTGSKKGDSTKIAADKVKISHETLRKTKKIKQAIEKDEKDKKDSKLNLIIIFNLFM